MGKGETRGLLKRRNLLNFRPLLELLFELREALFQFRHLSAQRRQFRFQRLDPGVVPSRTRGNRRLHRRRLPPSLRLSGKQLHITPLLLSGLLRQQPDQRGIPLLQSLQTTFEFLGRTEMENPLRPGTQFPRRLRSAQQQNAHDGNVAPIQLEMLRQIVPVLLHPRTAAENNRHQFLVPQAADARLHGLLIVGGDGIPARSLVASRNQAVQGERVRLRHRPLFLEQTTEDPSFNRGQVKRCHGDHTVHFSVSRASREPVRSCELVKNS